MTQGEQVCGRLFVVALDMGVFSVVLNSLCYFHFEIADHYGVVADGYCCHANMNALGQDHISSVKLTSGDLS